MPRSRSALLSLLALSVPATADGAEAEVVLRWKAVDAAIAYELEIATDERFGQLVLRDRTDALEYRWNDFPAKPHFWRVRGVDPEGRAGHWSVVRRVVAEVGMPTLVRPADGARVPGRRVTLRFESGLGAVETVVILLPDGEPPRELTSSESRVRISGLRPGTYRWQAFGRDRAGRESDRTAVHSFVVVRARAAKKVAEPEPEPKPEPKPEPEPETEPESERAGAPPVTLAPVTVRPPVLLAGARVGWVSNLGAVSSPAVEIDLGYRASGPDGRLLFFARAGYHAGTFDVARASGRTDFVPVSVLASYEVPVFDVRLRGSAGPTAILAVSRLSTGATETRLTAGATALAGLVHAVGPGEVTVEIGGTVAPALGDVVRARATQLRASVGYAVGVW